MLETFFLQNAVSICVNSKTLSPLQGLCDSGGWIR